MTSLSSSSPLARWSDASLLELFLEVADSVGSALAGVDDRRAKGTRQDQYALDLATDEAALAILDRAGVGVLSEESGLRRIDDPTNGGVVVIIDPVDGSTNASRRIPWYATSLCAVDRDGPRVALVRNLATGTTFTAWRGGGAFRDGTAIEPSACLSLSNAIVAVAGMSPAPLPWRQYRELAACALDLCYVASGGLDGYIDCTVDSHGVWDYAGGMLVCQEVGVLIEDAHGRDLLVMDDRARRTPIAACTPELFAEIKSARSTF
jgi:myo-inositol-1(or 4)-monophosphatase